MPTSVQDVSHLDEPDALHDDEHGPRGCQKETVGAACLPHDDDKGAQDCDDQQGVHPHIQLGPLQARHQESGSSCTGRQGVAWHLVVPDLSGRLDAGESHCYGLQSGRQQMRQR